MTLTAVDTNVIVRLLTRDDPKQFEDAQRCFASGVVFVPESVLLETAWVLGAAYGFDEERIARSLRELMGLPNVRVTEPSRIALALDWYERGLDFADALHLANSQHASSLRTFDRGFVKRAAGVGACSVVNAAD